MMSKEYTEVKQELIEALQNGETILYPTDTIWGLGCDATNEQACQKVLEIKNRPSEKSFIVLMDSIQMLEKYVPEFHAICYDLIDFSTAPLTIIYPSAKNLAPAAVANNGSIAIRIPKDKTCLELIKKLKRPLVSTSANFSGEKSPEKYVDINIGIKKSVDNILIQRKEEAMRHPSQIIKIDLDGSVQVIRK